MDAKMTTEEIERQLLYFRRTCPHPRPREYAVAQRVEGFREKLCKGKEPTRSELLWLRSVGVWRPEWLCAEDELAVLGSVQDRWLAILDSEDVEEVKAKGVTRAEFTALERRVAKLEGKESGA